MVQHNQHEMCLALKIGMLPAEWSQLDFLSSLNVSDNNLSGALPEDWGGNGTWMQLQSLDLSSNNLTGAATLCFSCKHPLHAATYIPSCTSTPICTCGMLMADDA